MTKPKTAKGISIRSLKKSWRENMRSEEFKNAKEEYSNLIKKKRRNSREEDRLLELDCFIETAICREGAIPKHLKTKQSIKKLDDLNRKLDAMLAEIRRKKIKDTK